MSTPRVAAIVPAYNEEETVGAVVGALKQASCVKEVIVVSDGSTDATVARAREAGARVIALAEKGGKGQAMLAGVAATSAGIVAFFDADLIDLTPDHIERLVRPVVSGRRVMNVALRYRRRWMMPLMAHLPLISGIRAMERQVIEGVPPKYLKGYMVESALNFFCRSRGLRYGTVILRHLELRHKYDKVSLPRAVLQYARMAWQVGKAIVVVRMARVAGRF